MTTFTPTFRIIRDTKVGVWAFYAPDGGSFLQNTSRPVFFLTPSPRADHALAEWSQDVKI